MKSKRLLSLLLAIVMIAALFAGCAGNGPQTTTGATDGSTTAGDSTDDTTKAAELEEKTIQIWLYGNKQKDSEKVWAAFNEMLKEYVPNTTVEFNMVATSEYKEKYQQMLASGEPVDLAFAANWVTGDVSQSINNGDWMPLNDLIAEYGQGITEVLGQKILDFVTKPDGNIYYFVNWQGLAGNKHGIYVIKEIADLAGPTWLEDTTKIVDHWWNEETTPETLQQVFDQLDIYLAAAKEADMLGAGMDLSTLGWSYSLNLDENAQRSAIGVEHGTSPFKVIDAITTEYRQTVYKNLADFYAKGYIRSDIMSMDTSLLHRLNTGDGVIDEYTYCLTTHNFFTESTKEQLTIAAGKEMTIIPMERVATLANAEATINIIPYCADEPERATMVLNAIYTVPELYQLLIWGIEGEHWTDNGDGTINFTGGNSSDASYGYDNWKIGSCINSLYTQTMVPGYYDEMKELDESGIVSPFSSFVFDNTGLEDVLAALSAVDQEYGALTSGVLGDGWEAYYQEYLAQRKAAGAEQLLEAYTQQIEAYCQEKGITGYTK